ncbi:MAG TPA: hypothetical protein VFT49_02580 [Candidatus Saccharimonadales bacterium]|nr:hypothetical protein [Candidatus Saccharimonadales bacterium]
MKIITQPMKLPVIFLAGSLMGLLMIAAYTTPSSNIAMVVVFFFLLLVFLMSLGFGLGALRSGRVTPRWRHRTILVSLLVVLLFMFRSSQSLNWVDGVILLLTIGGISFYTDRRFY